jgi:hypothetical protein
MHEHAINNHLQVEATGSMDRGWRWLSGKWWVVQVLGHFTLQPDLLQLGDAKASLRLPRLVDGAAAAGASLASP